MGAHSSDSLGLTLHSLRTRSLRLTLDSLGLTSLVGLTLDSLWTHFGLAPTRLDSLLTGLD